MPIQSDIALQVRPVVAPDVIQSYGNALQIKSHIQNQQLQQMQMQTMDLENQQRKMQMEALKEYNAAMKEGYGGDPATPPTQPQAPPTAPQESPRAPDTPTSGGTLDPNTPASVRGAGAMNALAGPAPGTYGLQDALTPPQNPPTFKAPAAAPAPAQPMATPASQPAPNNGIPTVDYDKVARRLIQNGQGSQVMGLLSTRAKYMQELALQHKTEAEGHAEQLGQVAQNFQGVNGASPDQKEAVYQLALQHATPLAQKYGIDASHWPAHYDPATTPAFIDQIIGGATKLKDFADQTREAASLAHTISAGIPDTAKKVGDAYDSDVSQIRGDLPQEQGQKELDLKNAKWDATYRADPSGQTAKLFAAVRQKTWNPTMSQDATLATLKPDERVKYFTGQLNDSAQRLKSAALRGQAAYTAELGRQVGKNADLGNLFPAPPGPGEPWDGKAVATQAASVGATGEQYITAQNRNEYQEQLLAIRDRLGDISQQNADTNLKRANQAHETGKQHDQMILELATQAAQESGDKGGRSIDDVIANVSNTDNYKGQPIGDNRMEVLKVLRSSESQALINKGRQGASDKANPPSLDEQLAYRKAHPGVSISAAKAAIVAARHGGSSGTPTPKTQSTATPKATGSSIIVQPGDGSQAHSFPNEAAAQKFEALVKQAGGTTSRQ